ncbi:MAG: hypothetical protein R2695_18805 [Acidimicrobiales bacterium]
MGMLRRRAASIRALARGVLDGTVDLYATTGPGGRRQLRDDLGALPGSARGRPR